MSCSTDLDSGSPVKTVAASRWAVETGAASTFRTAQKLKRFDSEKTGFTKGFFLRTGRLWPARRRIWRVPFDAALPSFELRY